MKSNLLPIAQSGLKYILSALVALFVFEIFDFDFLTFVSFVFLIVFLYFFRNPERELPAFAQKSLVSPVDGVVTSIQEIEDENYAYVVEIDANYTNVGVLRVPMDSSVDAVTIHKGTRVAKSSKLFQDINEYAEILLSDNSNNKIKIVHRLKQSIDGISLDIIDAQKLRQAARYGFAVNGTTFVYIPKNFRLNVSVANELKASESLLGYFS